jgi:hypothetical protein
LKGGRANDVSKDNGERNVVGFRPEPILNSHLAPGAAPFLCWCALYLLD